jgi:hypothetical protein
VGDGGLQGRLEAALGRDRRRSWAGEAPDADAQALHQGLKSRWEPTLPATHSVTHNAWHGVRRSGDCGCRCPEAAPAGQRPRSPRTPEGGRSCARPCEAGDSARCCTERAVTERAVSVGGQTGWTVHERDGAIGQYVHAFVSVQLPALPPREFLDLIYTVIKEL